MKQIFLTIFTFLLIIVLKAQVSLDIRVYLEGPYETNEMITSLNSAGYIPLQQPYNAPPWNYNGTEQVAAIPNTDIVDWILVELRETPGNASTALENYVVARKAAFIMKDGTIRALDGSSLLSININVSANIFAVIRHRNHLPVMSAEAMAPSGNIYSYDFTSSVPGAYGGSLAQKEIASGTWGMMAGDGNADGQVSSLDKIDVWLTQVGSSGYKQGDFSMNGQVNNSDKIEVWKANTGKSAQLPGYWICGTALPVTHTAGLIAPVNKTVTYGTVETNLSGSNKCWITQNLGADHQATSAFDGTEASAGWYWQFNKKQGYKHDGTNRTPNTPWIYPINENSDWLTSNDPCALLLGTGWRLPTYTEWLNAEANGNWNSRNDIYNSVLKLHAGGFLNLTNSWLLNRGLYANYWSSTQSNNTSAWDLSVDDVYCMVYANGKSFGFNARCLHDNPSAWTCGEPLKVFHGAGSTAPVNKYVEYGTVTTDLSGINTCWITQNLGADHQAVSATDNTEASAGWYWQFNRKQGYRHDGTTRTPGTAWIGSINEYSDWLAENDPCTQLLGNGWRIPTYSEWDNADISGGWNNSSDAYNSVLKLHNAGYLNWSNGTLSQRGSVGYYWSRLQFNTMNASLLVLTNNNSQMISGEKSYASSVRCLKDQQAVWNCGQTLTVTHTAGDVSPVDKIVNYGTLVTNLTGSDKCWITQNLGADQQATSAKDATEASAGWYWQFNRKQGYKHDGITVTPAWTILSINESSDWLTDNDPCKLLLGTGWRIPTFSEWDFIDSYSNWLTVNDAYSSVLKLHAAGHLSYNTGELWDRGGGGNYWSSSQYGTVEGYDLGFNDYISYMLHHEKAYGFSVRCLRD